MVVNGLPIVQPFAINAAKNGRFHGVRFFDQSNF
jgi:hypothetical protein